MPLQSGLVWRLRFFVQTFFDFYIKKKPTTFKRKSFPAHLPREEESIQPQDIKADDPQYTKIGENITELLKYHPAHLTVKKIIRPKYIIKNDEDAGVKQALGMRRK